MTPLAEALAPSSAALIAAFVADLIIGDPVYRAHPIRLIGGSLRWFEDRLRAWHLDGYAGGILLFVVMATCWLGVLIVLMSMAQRTLPPVTWLVHAAILYTMLALGDLLHHVWRIESAAGAGDLPRARTAVGALVGRDTDGMDVAACRRAAVESLSENLTDGFVSPLAWYVIGGLPGIVLFKIVSTMDSMVGYKTPAYLRFGWCGARLDDVMNYLPARATWLVMAAVAWVLPGFSGRKAWRVGLRQHAVLLGPNSGWSEAAMAGALARRIVGPIWLRGTMVTDVWVGDATDPPLETANDVTRAIVLTVAVACVCLAGALLSIGLLPGLWR